ncbi:putative ribonuclease H protein [Vitis vinifera]|uniref:Putative ribonuclease H protein n=1 Tax=Vitis vinifera TaxID=29760 RepID=A0A438JJK9_VITVI|nr:putative ribonuclease H protein [Vitis vinifera]
MIPVGRVLNIEGLALELGCKVGGIPSSYLGMPLGAAFNTLAVWDGVEKRFRRRLAMWKRQYISKGKSEVEIGENSKGFSVGGGTLAHKPHLVRWNLVCLEKRKGGLGVRNLSLMNNALLCKWNWRFANERDALWRSVISLKYGVEEGGCCTRDVMGRNGVGLWKAIRKRWGLFDGRVAFHLGNGQRVKFWKDKWLWAFNDWEIDLVERLLQKIQAFRVQREEEDRVIWTTSKDGAFSLSCAWEASWGKVLTQEQLQRRGFSLANRCFLCLPEEETVDHLLLHCIKTRVLWNLLFSLFGISWTLSCTVKTTLLGWNGGFVGKRRKKAWQMAPLCIFWGSLAQSHSSLNRSYFNSACFQRKNILGLEDRWDRAVEEESKKEKEDIETEKNDTTSKSIDINKDDRNRIIV